MLKPLSSVPPSAEMYINDVATQDDTTTYYAAGDSDVLVILRSNSFVDQPDDERNRKVQMFVDFHGLKPVYVEDRDDTDLHTIICVREGLSEADLAARALELSAPMRRAGSKAERVRVKTALT